MPYATLTPRIYTLIFSLFFLFSDDFFISLKPKHLCFVRNYLCHLKKLLPQSVQD
jgi:hypothetical protein